MKTLSISDPYQSNISTRIIPDLDNMKEIIKAIRRINIGSKIVLTMGSFDNAHVGHYRYLEKARSAGAFLVVGIDSDEKIRNRKGKHRPVVGQEERAEILCHTRYTDLVIIKEEDWEKWALIDAIRPDVLVATKETYTEEQIKQLKEKFSCEVKVLEPQAQTSTTAKIRKLVVDGMDQLSTLVSAKFPSLLKESMEEVLDGLEKPKKRK